MNSYLVKKTLTKQELKQKSIQLSAGPLRSYSASGSLAALWAIQRICVTEFSFTSFLYFPAYG